MNLLLDACTLIRLVHSKAYGQYLIALENYVQNGNIVLLTHSCVVQEWENHKEGNKKRTVKKIAKQHHLPVQTSGDLLPAPVTINHIDLQYQQIDRLLQAAVMLSTPDQIKYEFYDRYVTASPRSIINSTVSMTGSSLVQRVCIANAMA